MKAVIMAGGFGTRIRPLTASLPKPMLPIVNIPIMEHVINLLKQHGIKDYIVLLYFQPDIIKNYFKGGSSLGVNIKYVLPSEDYGTAGAVGLARDYIDDTFIVISADLLTDFDLSSMVEFHKSNRAWVTIGLVSVANPLQFGVVITDTKGKVMKFLEKPGWGEIFSDTVNTGIYVLEPEVFSYIPNSREFDFSKDLFPVLLSEGIPIYGYKYNGYWRDIGDPESYREGHYDVFDGAVRIKIPGKKLDIVGRDVRVGDNTEIDESVRFEKTVVIGDECKIMAKAIVKNSSLGTGCVVEEGAFIEDCIIWDKVKIGKGARLSGCIICNNCIIGEGASLGRGVVIAENCVVGKNATVKDGIKVWPSKIIEDEATVTDNLIWGEKWKRRIFENSKVVGLTNKELTPEFVAKLGVAYGSSLPKKSSVITGRDSIAGSRMLKRAFIGGLLSAGVNVKDSKLIPEPVLRFKLQTFGEVGGIYFRKSAQNPEITEIHFYDSQGVEISSSFEKNVERIFAREDFRRVSVYDQGFLEEQMKIKDFYVEHYLKALDVDAIKKSGFKIVVDFFHGPSSVVMPELLSIMRCNVIGINATTERIPLEVDIDRSLEDLSKIVVSVDADAGFLITEDCRKIFVVDEKGNIISNEALVSVMLWLMAGVYDKGVVAFSVTVPEYVEAFAKDVGFEIKRIPTRTRAMLDVARYNDTILVTNHLAEFIFPEFQYAFDGMYVLGKLLELMAKRNVKLSYAFESSPKGFFVRESIACPWELKGYIMRKLSEEFSDKELSLIDGVKVFVEDGWFLGLPDQEKPLFHIFVEAKSPLAARNIMEDIKSRIEQWRSK